MINLAEYYKDRMTWSVEDAKALLSSAAIRVGADPQGGAEVEIDGRWMSLGRADLMDNVATFLHEDINDLEATRSRYLQHIIYGARKNEWSEDRVSFSVIDQLTDG